MEVENPKILLPQETMMEVSTLDVRLANIFPHMSFLALYVIKRSISLVSRFLRNMWIKNSRVEAYNVEVDKRFLIINIYGHYDDSME